ncbi:MAG: SMP-30/gluconolactonase/LRE family protein [Acidimicrobiales bacterium]|jgi:sugar lactone lactonase YvrE
MQSEMQNVVDGLTFAEGLRWHDHRLWFSDMYANEVHTWSDSRGDEIVVRTESSPSGLGWTLDGELLIASMEDRLLLRVDGTGGTTVFADLSAHTPHPINDMVIDTDGRAYIGEFGFDLNGGADPSPGVIIAVEPDGTHKVVAEDLTFPNGMVITDLGRTLVFAETFAGRLSALDKNDDGTLSNPRLWAALPEGATPDGICIDSEGAVWAATIGTGECIRVAEGGEILDRVNVGETLAIACCLGGREGRTLFVATSDHIAPDLCHEHRHSGIKAFGVEVGAA